MVLMIHTESRKVAGYLDDVNQGIAIVCADDSG